MQPLSTVYHTLQQMLHPRLPHLLFVLSIFLLASFPSCAQTDWDSYPSCATPCLEYYTDIICGGYDVPCICAHSSWAGGVAECSRVACGLSSNAEDLTSVWTALADTCLLNYQGLGGVPTVMLQPQFFSSAGVGTEGLFPISTTATIFGSQTTFTIDPGKGLTAAPAPTGLSATFSFGGRSHFLWI